MLPLRSSLSPIPSASAMANATLGNIQCYKSFTTVAYLLDLVQVVAGFVGVSCSPMSVVSTGSGTECKQQSMCCGNNKMNGLVNVGYTPINLNL
ncbi:hypothetical protein BD769DRAFT_1485154 [Suillus cothurnatus]|nr:hypothetical protein BD769DRAFT_1485154 [Suillus cothurnatus]